MHKTVHPDVVLDDVDEVIDEPNFNNPNTSPDPPSPYADLEKKYRKNRFNKSRNKKTPESPGYNSLFAPVSPKASRSNKVQKRKSTGKPSAKPARHSPGKRNS
ncbi:MAG: hypothetical protein K9I59_03890 [Chlorobium sp.]|uniref:hypothetical protein n=1 Tax=Chlorobium sp. TaxID=1095 RepID=UPI001DF9C57D|nr:hypothetical protein [Chlorobium sp.]MBN1278684.1 hypothetical protein [Chlorobiaceae bacterium]MCF8216671.1 hypothetical protein [Chlorobium sp.]MCF8270868.1 hypothetical protein [Chlorobium sp.]MCF8287198.1 hypothetical protein [Chlorobium sp.]MCF8290855.1 hypothetical protein [Chlorobium sp.]